MNKQEEKLAGKKGGRKERSNFHYKEIEHTCQFVILNNIGFSGSTCPIIFMYEEGT